jgi:DnaJ-class molecular chaperone
MIKNPYMKENEDCKCCNGRGVQRNQQTGMNQLCPCCNGSGKRKNVRDKTKIWMG